MPDALSSPNQMPESIGRRVRRAVLWRSGSQIGSQLVQWAATFLVIRLLDPRDYGLFAMTQAVLVLLNMANGYGLASGLVQQPEITRREIRQLFGMLILLNGSLALIQLAAAPLAAAYYHQPAVARLLRVQALLYLPTPLIALGQALLAREVDFRHQATANVAGALAGAVTALAMAFAGWGVWTLVWAPIALFSVRATVLTVTARALVWPDFDFRGAGTLARFGGIMAAGQLTWFLQSQADVLIAGRSFSPHLLGIYTTSLFLTQIFVSKFVPPLNDVAFSAYARLQDDQAALARGFVQASAMVMAAALPFYLGLAVTAGPAVAVALGPHWAATVPVVRLLALALPFMTMQVLLGPACDARGRPDIAVSNGLIGAGLLAAAFLVGARHGPTGLALAWIVAYPVYLAISARRALPVIGVGARDLLAAIAPSAMAAAVMALTVHAADLATADRLPALARLALLAAIGAGTYAGWLWIAARDLVERWRATVLGRPTAR